MTPTINGERPRILVVDDNTDFAENLSEILDLEGYDVRTAQSCAQARGAVDQRATDVALVDLRLPDGNGTDLARELKALNPDCEVILLTGFATIESAAASVRAGACAYLVKPCATPELLLTVEQAMRQVRLHQEKRALARRVQVTEKLAAVGTMTAGLSHEIRNPLNAATLQLTVLERRIKRLASEQQPPLLEPLSLVQEEIRRLDHILEDFLQFARPVKFAPQPVRLSALIGRVTALLSSDAETRGVHLEQHCDRDPVIAGDEGRLRQVVMNLVLNALDASPRGGKVTVRCQEARDEVALVIEDTGPGIPPENLVRIFEPFFTTKASGSGLGLPIVHAIVSQHGGSIQAENVPRGGARFTLHFPKEERAVGAASRKP